MVSAAGLEWSNVRRDGGDRPLLVVGPSLGTAVGPLWGAVAAQVRDQYDVLGWELPGHAGSAPLTTPITIEELAARVASGVQELTGRSTFSYAGDSIGGAVGLVLVLDHAELVSSATLACTSARFGVPKMWMDRATLVRAKGTEAIVESALARWFSPSFADREPAVTAELLDVLRAADDESYALLCEALARFDLRDRLHDIETPLTVIAGRDDLATPVPDAQRIVNAARRARLVVLSDVAHLAPVESPARVASLIAAGVEQALEV